MSTTEPYALGENYKHIIHVVGPDCRRPNQDEERRELLPKPMRIYLPPSKNSVILGPL